MADVPMRGLHSRLPSIFGKLVKQERPVFSEQWCRVLPLHTDRSLPNTDPNLNPSLLPIRFEINASQLWHLLVIHRPLFPVAGH